MRPIYRCITQGDQRWMPSNASDRFASTCIRYRPKKFRQRSRVVLSARGLLFSRSLEFGTRRRIFAHKAITLSLILGKLSNERRYNLELGYLYFWRQLGEHCQAGGNIESPWAGGASARYKRDRPRVLDRQPSRLSGSPFSTARLFLDIPARKLE